MPSVAITGSGIAKVSAALALNRTTTSAKAAGTATTNITRVTIPQPPEFVQNSNSQITNAIIAGSGPSIGTAIGYVVGSALGSADNIRRTQELALGTGGNDPPQTLFSKIQDRTIRTNVDLNGNPITQGRDGRYIDVSGSVTTNFLSSSGNRVLVGANDNGTDEVTLGVGYAQTFNWRMGLSNIDQSVGTRKQT